MFTAVERVSFKLHFSPVNFIEEDLNSSDIAMTTRYSVFPCSVALLSGQCIRANVAEIFAQSHGVCRN